MTSSKKMSKPVLLYIATAVIVSSGIITITAFAPQPTVTRKMTTVVPSLSSSAIVLSNTENDSKAMIMGSLPLLEKETEEKVEVFAKNEKLNKPKNVTPVVSMLKSLFDRRNKKEKKKENEMGLLTRTQLMAAVAALALTFAPVNNADAAMTGGRIGGSYHSSSPSSSYSRPSMSRSVPSSSRSYSRGYSHGYSSGYYRNSRPSVTIAPSFGYSGGYSPFGSPFYSPFATTTVPRVYGSPGIISYARGPSFFDLILVGGFMYALSQMILIDSSIGETNVLDNWLSSSTQKQTSALGSGTDVVKLSVALEVPDRDDRNSILSVLNRLSQTAKTDSRVGIQNLSSQVALEILRRRSSIVSASSANRHFNNQQKAQREFQNLSIKERSKFETETISKYGGVDYNNNNSDGSNSIIKGGSNIDSSNKATIAVITLILNIDGDSTQFNRINSIDDVTDALQKIATNSKVDDCLQSAEILWTPEQRSETLNVRDVVADYPELRSV